MKYIFSGFKLEVMMQNKRLEYFFIAGIVIFPVLFMERGFPSRMILKSCSYNVLRLFRAGSLGNWSWKNCQIMPCQCGMILNFGRMPVKQKQRRTWQV